jgi:hypothetical protein
LRLPLLLLLLLLMLHDGLSARAERRDHGLQ